jgi:hypothetical protein
MLQAAIVLFAHHHCRRPVSLHQLHRAAPNSLLDGSYAGTEHMIKEVGHLKQLADEEFAARG